MTDQLHERGKTLEDQFFHDQDKKLLDKLRAEIQTKEASDSLAMASGIQDPAVLKSLVENGVTAETFTALSLYPLIAVAWADGTIEAAEQAAVLKAAHASGIEEGTAGHDLIEAWLRRRPSDELMDDWKSYVGLLKKQLDHAAFGQLSRTIIKRAKDVAKAAGGFLGIAPVSEAEKKIVAELEEACS